MKKYFLPVLLLDFILVILCAGLMKLSQPVGNFFREAHEFFGIALILLVSIHVYHHWMIVKMSLSNLLKKNS